jgi:hypothetical protein
MKKIVIPAKAGIHATVPEWIPDFAGKTWILGAGASPCPPEAL